MSSTIATLIKNMFFALELYNRILFGPICGIRQSPDTSREQYSATQYIRWCGLYDRITFSDEPVTVDTRRI